MGGYFEFWTRTLRGFCETWKITWGYIVLYEDVGDLDNCFQGSMSIKLLWGFSGSSEGFYTPWKFLRGSLNLGNYVHEVLWILETMGMRFSILETMGMRFSILETMGMRFSILETMGMRFSGPWKLWAWGSLDLGNYGHEVLYLGNCGHEILPILEFAERMLEVESGLCESFFKCSALRVP